MGGSHRRGYFCDKDAVWCIHCCKTLKYTTHKDYFYTEKDYAKHNCEGSVGPLAIDWRLAWMDS